MAVSGHISEKLYQQLYGERGGTTDFFRSAQQFPRVLTIFQEDTLKKRETGLEIIVIGCSTGEDAFSYALLCETNGFKNYQVHGCDVETDRLRAAENGIVRLNWETSSIFSEFGILPELYEVDPDSKKVTIKPKIREKCAFFYHDISLEPVPKTYDLVVCTNVLCQSQLGEKHNAIQNVYAAVAPGGIVICELKLPSN